MPQEFSEAFYGRGRTDLEHLIIPDGVSALGACAFASCPNLRSVTFPISLVEIGQGAFRDCPCLGEVHFADGNLHIEIRRYAFANTPISTTIMALIGEENFRRSAKKVRVIYERAKNTPFFIKYSGDYARTCSAYDKISDWSQVSDSELKHLVWDREHGVSTVRMGGMSEDCFNRINKGRLRDICCSIAQAGGDNLVTLVEQQRSRFYSLLESTGERRQLHEVFNRMVCSICRERKFVQIIDVNRLNRVEAFLADHRLRLLPCSTERFTAEDWSRISCAVYATLKNVLPNANPYEIGVFSWCLADVLGDERMHNDENAIIEMREAVRTGFREVQYI